MTFTLTNSGKKLTPHQLPFLLLCLTAHSISFAANGQPSVLTEEDVYGDIPVVSGASHFVQKISEAPTSVSIINRQMIDASGAIEIVDLFRLIPGFQVYFPHYGRHAINYHGVPQEYSYRMEVKVDGRSVYEPSENAVLWPTLPIELKDIDYIEVIRGANAPADGANATIASVNIVTTTPIASKGLRLTTSAGDWDTQNTSFAYSGLEQSFSYKLNGGYRYSSGFPNNGDERFSDDAESSYLNLRTIISPSLFDSIDIQLGYSNNNIDMADSGRSLSVEDISKWNYDSYYFSANWTRALENNNRFTMQFYYNHADIDAPVSAGLFSDLLEIPSEAVPAFFGFDDFEVIFGLYDAYAERSDLELRYQGSLSTNTRYMVGVASRYDVMKSDLQFYFDKTVEESSQRLFSNIESKPSEHWTLNVGAIIEYNNIVNSYGSYRLSANYHFNPNHTIRLAYNNGERSPGLYEANQNNRFVREGQLLDIDTLAPDNLTTEKFESQEITYYSTLLDQALTVEIKLFKEKNRDLVKYTIVNTTLDLDQEFALRSNSAWADTEGVETQIKYQPGQHWLINFQYSYVNQTGKWLRLASDHPNRFDDWGDDIPQQISSLMAAYFFDSGFEASVVFSYQDEANWQQGNFSDDYQRTDIRLAKRFPWTNCEVLIELIGQNIFDEDYTEFHRLNRPDSRYLARVSLDF